MQAHRQMTAGRIAEYDTYRERAHQAIAEYEARGPGADLVAQAVARIVSSRNPRLRYVLGRQARFVVRVRRLLPAGMFEQGVRSHFRLDDGGR